MTKNIKTLVTYFIIATLFYNCKNDQTKDDSKKQDTPKKYVTALDESIQRGESIYNDLCITCHMANGQGSPKVFPPLANSDYLKNNQEASIRGIKYGQEGEIIVNGVTYNTAMAPQGLDDKEIADVMNYINNAWGNSYGKEITEGDVVKITK